MIAGLRREPGLTGSKRAVFLAEAQPLVAEAIALTTSQPSESIAASPLPAVTRVSLLF